LHQPFTRKDYLDFCIETYKKYRCSKVTFIGDLVDHHGISYHEKDPDGMSPGFEFEASKKSLRSWYRAFPEADWVIGNHDALIARKTQTMGLPSAFMRPLQEVYGCPAGWRVGFTFVYGNTLVKHGTGSSGDAGAFTSMLHEGMNIVQGHIHTASGVRYHASEKRLLWAMQLGWGADRHAYAFAYGRDFKRKPIVNCGVELENGTLPVVIPMHL